MCSATTCFDDVPEAAYAGRQSVEPMVAAWWEKHGNFPSGRYSQTAVDGEACSAALRSMRRC